MQSPEMPDIRIFATFCPLVCHLHNSVCSKSLLPFELLGYCDIIKIIHLVLVPAFWSCVEPGLLFSAVHGRPIAASYRGAQALGAWLQPLPHVGSVVKAPRP